jgi:pyruvate/oxaloacetate carboxyltransferase
MANNKQFSINLNHLYIGLVVIVSLFGVIKGWNELIASQSDLSAMEMKVEENKSEVGVNASGIQANSDSIKVIDKKYTGQIKDVQIQQTKTESEIKQEVQQVKHELQMQLQKQTVLMEKVLEEVKRK